MSYNNNHDNNNNINETLFDMSEGENMNNLQDPMYAPKRYRESTQRSLTGNVSKTPRLSITDSPFKLLNTVDKKIDKRFDNFLSIMKTMFQESEARMEARMEYLLNKRFDELKSDLLNLNERVIKLETVGAEIANLKSEVQTLKTQLQRQENSTVASDLRINGIPYTKGENLHEVFKSICEVLNISTPAIKALYRLQNHNNKDRSYSPDAVIMVKLFSPYDKNFILKCMAGYRKANRRELMLSDFGLGDNRPFYVNENLTTANHKILLHALNLKKRGLFKAVYTIRGLVHVKLKDNDDPVRIDDHNQLLQFFPDNSELN